MADEMDIRAEVLPDDLKGRVRGTLKKSLQAQLEREARTLGAITGPDETLAIHGRTGISTYTDPTR